MTLELVMKTFRSAVIEIKDGGIYYTAEPYDVYVNGEWYKTTNRVITSIFGLKPQTEYSICIKASNGRRVTLDFVTAYEFVTLDVKKFGAKGDGSSDDTLFIQSAIMACPKDGRVSIPKGIYRITSLFLKSDISIELAKDAVLLVENDRQKFPKLPGLIESYDETKEYNLGTWEGNPLPMFSGIITGIDVENVTIYGQGTIDGQASNDNWWYDAKKMRGAFRPRMVFLERCKKVRMQGITLKNSPTWVIHPYFSEDLRFVDLTIQNPADSPNTDGLDPESCRNVQILGMHFSLGDDCIAIKSGKIYMGRKYKIPSQDIMIRQCLMENGHGAVTVGSEVGAGVKNVQVKECIFRNTDRGLRIKTRRGRGRDSVLDYILFDRIHMEDVMTPFVVNSFYFCDPDGRTEYVQTREALPVDERTPFIKRLYFHNIKAENCHVAASFLYGLPEQKIEMAEFENIEISFAKDAKTDVPAMLDGTDPCSRKGFYICNVKKLICRNVSVNGQEGEAFEVENVEYYVNE